MLRGILKAPLLGRKLKLCGGPVGESRVKESKE